MNEMMTENATFPADAGRAALIAVLRVTLADPRGKMKSATHLSELIFQYGNLPFILFLENIIHKGGLTGLLVGGMEDGIVEEEG